MEIDRTSCTRFWANQFRVLLTAAAYVLMQNYACRRRDQLRKSAGLDTAERFLKLGARSLPQRDAWSYICRNRSRFWRPSAHGLGTGSAAWVESASLPEEFPFSPDPNEHNAKPRPKIVATSMVCACKACSHVPRINFTLPSSSSAILCRPKPSSRDVHE